jgi:hypothetical protein
MKFGPKIVTDGLVLALDAANPNSYPGSGTAWNDLTPNKNNGTLVNGPTFNDVNGGFFSFDGVNEYSYIDNSSLTYNRSNFSVETWVKPTGNHSNFEVGAFSKWNTGGGTDNEFLLGFWNTNGPSPLWFTVQSPQNSGGFNGRGAFNVESNFNYIVNQWYHLVGTFDGPNSTLKLYVDGVLVDTNTTFNDTQVKTVTTNYYIGAFEVRLSILASISKCALYNKTLSATEVLQNYNALKDRFI